MYNPPQFDQPSFSVMYALIKENPLATIVTLDSNGLNANHIPLVFSETTGAAGFLRGHVARANPIWQDLATDNETLAIFHGPEAYISPSWYATKAESGKVVPTWNYAVVHAHGCLNIIDDEEWVRAQLEMQTQQSEAGFPCPWAVSDAPEEFIERLVGKVVGIEIEVTRLTGKWKVSQNQPIQNQNSVIDGLYAHNQPSMAELVKAGIPK